MSNKKTREDNPFEDEKVASEWITSIEGERGLIRDRELYPLLRKWSTKLSGTVLDIGSGQGICADYTEHDSLSYIGVEPSKTLVSRAKEKYSKNNRKFLLGNAYELPIEDDSCDSAFSVNVWFHLEDLDTANKELHRVLKPGGVFLISTANPACLSVWENMFEDADVTDKVIDGKVNIPVQSLSRNRFYKHSKKELIESLQRQGLVVDDVQGFGSKEKFNDEGLFLNIYGHKESQS